MAYRSTAIVPTAQASRYLQQLCKHWAHNLAVTFDAQQGEIIFPKNGRGADWPDDGRVTLVASDTVLSLHIEASADGQRDGLKGAIERHLDRFAFRESAFTYVWQDS